MLKTIALRHRFYGRGGSRFSWLSVAFLFGALVAGAMLARAIMNPPAASILPGQNIAPALAPYYIAAIVAIFASVSVAVFWRLDVGIIFMFVLLCSIIRSTAQPKPFTVGGQGLYVGELLLFTMLGIVFFRKYGAVSKDPPQLLKSPIVLPLLLFLVWMPVNMLITWYDHPGPGPWDYKWAYNYMRPTVYYLLFFPAWFALNNRARLRVVIASLTVIALIVALLTIAQAAVGENVRLFLGATEITKLGADPEQSGAAGTITRTYAPGAALIMVIAPFAFYMAMSSRRRLLYAVLTAVLIVGLIFSFTRNYWVAALLSVFIVAFLGVRNIRAQNAIAGLFTIVVGVGIAVFVGQAVSGENFGKVLLERVQLARSSLEQMRSGKAIRGTTWGSRALENRQVLGLMQSDLRERGALALLGGGPEGGTLGTATYVNRLTNQVTPRTREAIHNGYLEVLAVYGVPGIAAFVAVCLAFLHRALSFFRRSKDPFLRGLALAFFAAFLSFLAIRAWVTLAILHEPENIIAFAFMWGTVEALWYIEQRERSTGEQHGRN